MRGRSKVVAGSGVVGREVSGGTDRVAILVAEYILILKFG